MWPETPWRIDDRTPIPERIRILRALVDQGKADPVVQQYAQELKRSAPNSSHYYQFAVYILERIQCDVPYLPDPPGEWFQVARYTMAYGGDCEDKVVLFLAVYELLGYGCDGCNDIVWQLQDGAPLDHVTAIVMLGDTGLWADPSICGAHLGEEPHDAARRLNNFTALGGKRRAA